ncbi:MAG: PhzF family phenazine biosynthesis protein [Gammaproteobacteria bacterium]
MNLDIYQVDAFTGRVFAGNPAAVCPLPGDWPADEVLQAIAAENNLSETAYFRSDGDAYALRWFTPASEVDLCGHATLASAYVIFNHLDEGATQVRFRTQSGHLEVERDGDLLRMDFPRRPARPVKDGARVAEALGREPEELLLARDYLAIYASQADVAALAPDMQRLERLGACVIASAPGDEADFVSRFFAPHLGIPEDPVTGSAHCTLVPYWSERLGRRSLHCRQISRRGGELFCEDRGERVSIAGRAVLYLRGEIRV